MSLASLLNIPEPQDEKGWWHWAHDHAQHTLAIRSAIQNKRGVNQIIYVLDPMRLKRLPTKDAEGEESFILAPDDKWLEDHQQNHNDFNGLLGLIGQDIDSVNWADPLQRRAWRDIHYAEHLAAATTLGI